MLGMFRFVFLSFIFPVMAVAQDDLSAHAEWLVSKGVPAAGVALYKNGEGTCKVAGRRAVDQDVPVAETDLWHIGSLTKSMTGTLAARMVVRGQIRWESTVGEVLNLPNLPKGHQDITLMQLLAHRAGLPANLDQSATLALMREQETTPLPEQRLDYATTILSQPLLSEPGSSFAYSNAGYVIAGAMLEAVSGRAWEDLMREEVFNPLGLDTAGFGPPGTLGVVDQPRGHTTGLLFGLKSVEPDGFADNIAAMGPAGTVHISLCDLLQYAVAHATRPPDYLPKEMWEALHRDRGDGYGFGWSVSPDGNLGHSGANTFWFAQVAVWPAQKGAAVVVTNDGRINRVSGQIQEVFNGLSQ